MSFVLLFTTLSIKLASKGITSIAVLEVDARLKDNEIVLIGIHVGLLCSPNAKIRQYNPIYQARGGVCAPRLARPRQSSTSQVLPITVSGFYIGIFSSSLTHVRTRDDMVKMMKIHAR